MKNSKAIRNTQLFVLLCGTSLWFIPLLLNIDFGEFLLNISKIISDRESREFTSALIAGITLISIWNILPHFIYYYLTLKMKSLIQVMIPGIALIGTQSYLIIELHTIKTNDGMAGLVVVTWPLGEFLSLGIGFAVGFFVKETVKKINTMK